MHCMTTSVSGRRGYGGRAATLQHLTHIQCFTVYPSVQLGSCRSVRHRREGRLNSHQMLLQDIYTLFNIHPYIRLDLNIKVILYDSAICQRKRKASIVWAVGDACWHRLCWVGLIKRFLLHVIPLFVSYPKLLHSHIFYNKSLRECLRLFIMIRFNGRLFQ